MMKNIIYNSTIGILACVSVVFAILDIVHGLNTLQYNIDLIIYFVFVFDYVIRLIISKNKKLFFKENILDLISIIPLNSAFRAFRILKLGKLARMTKLFKLVKLGAYTARGIKKAKRFLDTNGFKYMLLLVCALMLLGAVGISYVEKMDFADALWWSFVTTTTVGYGDISPSTGIGRLIASALMLVGIGLIGSLTSTITSFFFNKKTNDICSEKVKMVEVLYNELSEGEKIEFKRTIDK